MKKYEGPGCPEGKILPRDGGYTVQFERLLPHPPEKVWGALTVTENLALWLGEMEIDLRQGGRIRIRFPHSQDEVLGEITALVPGALLEYTWESRETRASLVRWELTQQEGDHCRLLLRHTAAGAVKPSLCSGWHVHLGLLADMLEEVPDLFRWPGEAWEEWDRYYAQKLAG
ncbi:MAG TPA: SRPBCC family protein [Chitinophagaceae bacterium]|nr:SRPBCC family protein [Chitinophagaceae bacterium]